MHSALAYNMMLNVKTSLSLLSNQYT